MSPVHTRPGRGPIKSRFSPEAVAVRKRDQNAQVPEHGWARADDLPPGRTPARTAGEDEHVRRDQPLRRPQSSRGLPLVIFVALGVVTSVALARVHAQNRALEVADELTDLADEHERLLDEKRRLETERAYLRHPRRIREYARRHLDMIPTPPDRVHRLRIDGES